MNENIFESTKEDLDNVLSFLYEREASLSHASIIEQLIGAQKKIENLKKENPLITETELKDDKEITELFENIEFWASEDNFEVSTPTLQNLDLIYAEAISFACKEANRLIDQSEEEVLDNTLDAETEKEITESNNKFRENFNKTRDFAEKYLDDNADRYLRETYNNIIVRNGELFDFVEAEISEDDDEYRWNNALYVVISEDYNKDILAKFNEEWEVSLNPAEVLYNFIESTKTLYNQAVEDFKKSSDEELSPIVAHFVEDLNSIDLENGRFSRKNLIRVEELRNAREAEKASQVEVEVKNESIEQPSVTISDSENSSTNNKPTFEENYNYAKKIFEGKTSGLADDVFTFEEMYKWEGEVFQSKKADEALLDSVSRMVYDNINFGELFPQTGNLNYDECFDTSVRFDFTEKIAGLILDRKLTSLDEIQQYAKDHNAEAALDVKYDYAEDFFKGKTSDMADHVRTFNEMRKYVEKEFPDKSKEWRFENIVSRMLYGNINFEKTSLSSKDFDDLYNVDGYDLRLDLCDDVAKKIVAGRFKDFDDLQKYAEIQSKEIVATYLAKDKELRNKIEWVNTKPLRPNQTHEDNAQDYIDSIKPGDLLGTLKIGACEVEVLKYEFSEKPNVFILNIYTLGKNDDYAVTSGGTPYGYDEGLTVKYDSSKSFEDFKKKVKKAAIKSIVLAGLGRELVRENIDWNNKEQVEKLMEEKRGENTMSIENRNVISPEFIRKLEDEEVSITKEEREKILYEVNSLEMSEKLKMVLTIQQDFEKPEEKPRTFILTPENRDEGDMDAEEIAKLLNKNNLPGQPEISKEQAECIMRYLRYNDIAVYVDQKDKFHIVDFSEDFTGEPGEVEDTKGFVETVLDEIDHGDGTEESYEHQKVLTPLIRHYSYELVSTSDIMQYLDTDDKNLARQIEEWQGGSENTGFIKDKFGNFALVVDDEIKKFKPDDVCDMVMNDFNMKIKHDKNLSELDCINLQDSVNRLWNIKADLRQVSWEQIEKLIGSKESGWVGYIKGDIENENPDFTEREIKTEVLISLLKDSLDLRGLNKYYGETGYDENRNILYRLASEIVQSKDTIDNISLDKQVQELYDSEVMKSKKYRNYVKEGLIKSDFYLSKLIDPALKEAMDILPGDEHDTTSEKLLESAIKSIEDEYNREGVEPDFEQLETLIKGQDAINYGIKSIDMIRPTAEEIEIGLDNDWDLKEAIKGYTKTGSSELPDGVEVVERIDVMGTFDSDYEAASQAEKDGIKMLQIKDYEHNLLEEAEDYIGLFTDTSANREFLKVREKNVERKTFTSDRDVFNNFISDVKKEYRELKLFRQATINVLKNLPEQERKIVNRELKKRGAINENSLASIMKNAVCEDKKQQKERRHKKESDVDYER